MKNLFKKIRNFKLIRETEGYLVAGMAALFFFMTAIGVLANVSAALRPHVYDPNESTSSPTVAEEESKAVGVVIVINGVPTFSKYSAKSPDPTPINKLTEEIVLPKEEYKSTGSAEEFFGGTAVIEYGNAISDVNKENQSKESEPDKISDDKTKQQLAQSQLPDDKLSIDIYNSINNMVSENIKDSQLINDVENTTSELVKNIFSRNEGTSNSEENVVSDIKENLQQKKLLAEKEVSEKRKYLKLAQQAKGEYEQRVAVIDKLGAESVWTQNLVDYKNDRRIIEDLNRKISEAEQFLNNYETKIASETSITVKPNESATENTAGATQPGETTTTVTQPAETSPETAPNTALPAELNLKGNISSSLGEGITLNINFETQIVSGTISYSGPMTWAVYDIDENGNKIPGTEKNIVLQTTATGTINGKIDINNKLIDASLSESYSAYWEEKNKNLTMSGTTRMSGSLYENNDASGTTTEGIAWSAKPN